MSLEIVPLAAEHFAVPWINLAAPEPIREQLLRLNSSGGVAVVMVEDGHAVGFCTIRPTDTPGIWSIELAVDDAHRRKGIGLVGATAALEIAFSERGISDIFALVQDDLSGAAFMSSVAGRLGAIRLPKLSANHTYYRITTGSWDRRSNED